MIDRDQLRSARRRMVEVALVAACAGVLLFHAGHGGRVTADQVSGPWRDQADAAEERIRCLAERVEALVPAGARVHVGPGPGVELQQRITELVAYGHADVVSQPADADLVLDSGPVASGGCGGITLRVVSSR